MTVEALRGRRPQALDDLLATYGKEIQGVAFLILRDRTAAEDVTIETLLTAFEKAGSIRDEGSLRSWLLRVATNKALGIRRSGARLIQFDGVPERVAPGNLADEATIRVLLLGGLAALPLAMRAAVVLRYYADLSVEDVAATLGKSPNTIKAQLQTALAKLRLTLAEPASKSAPEARHA